MGAVIYCRVSTKDQLQNFSIETQVKECEKYCARNGYTVLKTFCEARSAKNTERPEFQSMLEFCRQQHAQVEAVVVYAIKECISK